MRREQRMNPKCLVGGFPDNFSARSADLTGLKIETNNSRRFIRSPRRRGRQRRRTSRPSALAVLRLIASSYFAGDCTGSSAGFSPLRMRST